MICDFVEFAYFTWEGASSVVTQDAWFLVKVPARNFDYIIYWGA